MNKQTKSRLALMAVAVAAAFGDVISPLLLAAKSGTLFAGLALVVAKKEEIAEAHLPLYVEKDGKWHLDVDGIEDTSGLKSALASERTSRAASEKALKEFMKKYEGIDADKMREMLKRFETDDEARLIAEGKITEVIAKRTEKLVEQHKKDLAAKDKDIETANGRTGKFQQRVMENHIRQAAAKAGVHNHAVDDAISRARSVFVLDDEGDAVQLGQDGKPVLGKDGKTPYGPVEWMEEMKEKAPHWYPADNTGGGGGNGRQQQQDGRNGGKKTMKRSAFDALPPLEKKDAAQKYAIVD